MKAIFIAITILASMIAYAQPSGEDIKKHKIKKTIQRRIDDGGTQENFWYYDRNGNDSVKSMFGDTVSIKNTFKNGKLAEKTILRAKVNGAAKDDVYTYEYKPDGSYKVTYTDGSFGMKSYDWYDKKDNILKSQSPDGNTTTYKYEAKGKLVSVTSDGHNSGTKINRKYYYNAEGQLIKEENSMDENKSVYTYQYDAKGRLLKMIQKGGWQGENATVESKYDYNEKGLKSKIVMKAKTDEGESTTTYEYEYEYY
jgi:YD repeat-containing protein